MKTAAKRFLFGLAFAALCAHPARTQVPPDQASSSPPTEPQIFALVVGVSKYPRLPGGQQLQFADRDAASFAEAIRNRVPDASNVKLLTGANATAGAIKAALGNWLARSASENDIVLVFFSGHGFVERQFGEAYLLGYDSDVSDPYTTAISVSEIAQALTRRVRAGRVLIIADAVRSDLFPPESDGATAATVFVEAFDRLAASRAGVAAILASAGGEFSREGQRWGGHGVFTRHLLGELADNAGLTAGEMYDRVSQRVAVDTSNKQHPWRTKTDLAGFLLTITQRHPPVAVAARPPETSLKPEPRPTVAARKPEELKPSLATPPPPTREPKISPSKPAEATLVAKPTPPDATTRPPDARPSGVEPAGPPKPTPERPSSAPAPPAQPIDSNRQPAADMTTTPTDIRPTPPLPVKIAAASIRPEPRPNNERGEIAVRGIGPPPLMPPSPRPVAAVALTAERTLNAGHEIVVSPVPPPPKPVAPPPRVIPIVAAAPIPIPEAAPDELPVTSPEDVPTPLILQLEVALSSGRLIEPRNDNAWDAYQALIQDRSAASDTARLKPVLVAALITSGRRIVNGDVRSDNVADKVDDFRRAGQMFARARSLAPENTEIGRLEKLSAAEALISLQFYDEAERALAAFQGSSLATAENALGLVHLGRLDTYQAERAFKRACEMDPSWASPHYNLALLYRNHKNDSALLEFERAAALDPANPSLATALGDELFSRQQWQKSAEAYRKAVALRPADDTLHTKLGHALYSQGLREEADREYQKARELRSRTPQSNPPLG
ncbi:MAG TPA: tetratricopeptide repeat protein [Blastocatellia bacterium]|nr:tetratricopeptide repeat protein [Blastocatellia bacterium]